MDARGDFFPEPGRGAAYDIKGMLALGGVQLDGNET